MNFWASILLTGLCLLILYHLKTGAIFLPTNDQSLARIVQASKARASLHMVDLGSGDGRLVIALAKQGARVDGFEINPFLVWWSRYQIKQAGLNNAKIYFQSFWPADLSGYD